MSYCTSCGSDIPNGQGRSCSMCYGDVGHGKDRYYERWIEEQMWEEHERRIREESLWVDVEPPPPHKDDF